MFDPFSLWQSREHQGRRDRYRRILQGLAEKPTDAPCLVMFWIWGGRHDHYAKKVVAGAVRENVPNGYQDLKKVLVESGKSFLRVVWDWNYYCTMWISVPDQLLGAVQATLRSEIDKLLRHMLRYGYRTPRSVDIALERP